MGFVGMSYGPNGDTRSTRHDTSSADKIVSAYVEDRQNTMYVPCICAENILHKEVGTGNWLELLKKYVS